MRGEKQSLIIGRLYAFHGFPISIFSFVLYTLRRARKIKMLQCTYYNNICSTILLPPCLSKCLTSTTAWHIPPPPFCYFAGKNLTVISHSQSFSFSSTFFLSFFLYSSFSGGPKKGKKKGGKRAGINYYELEARDGRKERRKEGKSRGRRSVVMRRKKEEGQGRIEPKATYRCTLSLTLLLKVIFSFATLRYFLYKMTCI